MPDPLSTLCKHRDGRHELFAESEVRDLGDFGYRRRMTGRDDAAVVTSIQTAFLPPPIPAALGEGSIPSWSVAKTAEFRPKRWMFATWLPEGGVRHCHWCAELVEIGRYVRLTWTQWERVEPPREGLAAPDPQSWHLNVCTPKAATALRLLEAAAADLALNHRANVYPDDRMYQVRQILRDLVGWGARAR